MSHSSDKSKSKESDDSSLVSSSPPLSKPVEPSMSPPKQAETSPKLPPTSSSTSSPKTAETTLPTKSSETPPPKESDEPLEEPSETHVGSSSPDVPEQSNNYLPEAPLFPHLPRLSVGKRAWDTAVEFINQFKRTDNKEQMDQIMQVLEQNSKARRENQLDHEFINGLLLGLSIAEQEHALSTKNND